MNSLGLNERLIAEVQARNYLGVLNCLIEGARATMVCTSFRRTAIGTAAIVGDANILELLILSCEQPDCDMFNKNHSKSYEMETDCTPDGMDNLEWEDEFIENCNNCNQSGAEEAASDAEDTSLYYYYAKTFERTGAIISRLDESYAIASNLEYQQDIHRADEQLSTPLHYAAGCGNLECVRALLSHGASVDAVDSKGNTPLHVAVDSPEVVRILLKHGANPNLKTINTGETPLHLAIKNCNKTVVNIILQSAVNVNATDDNDQTPLMCAIAKNLEDIAINLIERGARVNLQNKDGYSALYYAVLRKNQSMTMRLLQSGARRITSHYLLHHCVLYDMPDIAEILLSYGNSLNVRNEAGATPILLAILKKNVNMLELLLRAAAVQQSKGAPLVDNVETELLIAVQYIDTVQEFEPIARVLFAYSDGRWMNSSCSTLPSSFSTFAHTPLLHAITLNKFDIAEFLVKEGLNISQDNCEHGVRDVRLDNLPRCLELTKLLVHIGYKFPYKRPPWPKTWTDEERHFEEEMFRFCNTPLPLQSICRIAVRNHLIGLLNSSVVVRQRYPTTKHESSLSRMIKHLDIPKMLQKYLHQFDDCASVMGNACNIDDGI
ncbi:serine/threonine-protein phosphatase 6 regulatory ankyrin repeat subunit B [Ceratitis capitata]|uniref:serine/threonine-protein phosphatase 6 regulatory ankyrin repeat subunit B n=1 Tax=Ceratitis capitata TaxID=7213 RepID=UPI000329D033|nr:serine/threonine-protein phosphatase 6 regulatory ankyrin repeat subunit B [Ceratitis capitata]